MAAQSLAARRRRCRGAALLEVTLSLVLLATAGTGLIALMGQSAHSLRQIRRAELQSRRASDELGRFVTYDRARLLASRGEARSREWALSVVQTTPDLFDVVIADTLTRVTILGTTFYRPDTANATTR
jgi:Tfp pilus assembly protein PilV